MAEITRGTCAAVCCVRMVFTTVQLSAASEGLSIMNFPRLPTAWHRTDTGAAAPQCARAGLVNIHVQLNVATNSEN